MQSKKNRSHTSVGLPYRTHALITFLSKQEKRSICSEIELLAEEECKRKGISLPAEYESPNSLKMETRLSRSKRIATTIK